MLTYCTFCHKPLTPEQAHTMHVRGKKLFVACDKHRDQVHEVVKTGALFTRGALIAGAKHVVNKKAPGLWEAATRAIGAYREITTPETEES